MTSAFGVHHEALRGKAFGPFDEEYATLRATWNASFNQRPALIVTPENTADVAAALDLARLRDLPVAVQATGHGIARPCDGGLLLNTARMRDVSVDSDVRTVTVQAGTQWADVLAQTQPHGLAPLSGSAADVGVVGYTLGGGSGWLVRAYGLCADSMLSGEVVTADGRVLIADETSNPDLFWALKGGGGNFGVVTSMTLRLQPVGQVYGGNLIFGMDDAPAVLRAYRDWLPTLPPEMTTSCALIHVPDMPGVPEPLRGRSVVAFRCCYAGDAAAGESLLTPLRAGLPGPVLDTVTTLPYDQVGVIGMDPPGPVPGRNHSEHPQALSDAFVDALMDIAGPTVDAPYTVVEIRHIGGGARPDEDRRGLAHWSADFLLNVVFNTPDEASIERAEAYARRLADALKPYVSGRTSLNFLGTTNRVADAFSEPHYARLVELKQRYDPTNLFRLNPNVPPTG